MPASDEAVDHSIDPSNGITEVTNRRTCLHINEERDSLRDTTYGSGLFTSYDLLRALLIDDDVIVLYSENGANGNRWIESFWSRLKEENTSLIGTAELVPEMRERIGLQVGYYDQERRHSGIDYRSPVEFLRAERRLPGCLSRNQRSDRFKFSGPDR